MILSKQKQNKSNKSFPDKWQPYPFQLKLWNYLASGGKNACVIWHRRAGKDLLGLHWITLCCLREPGLYWYVFPTETQGKLALWDGVTNDGKGYLSYIPKKYISEMRRADLTIKFTNGSVLKFVGASRPDMLRGAGIKGAVISEYAVMKEETVASVIMPMLARVGGWILYLYTPSSDARQTHGRELYDRLCKQENAFTQIQTIEDTFDEHGKPLVREKDLIVSGMSIEQIRREFYCDFDAWKLRSKDEGTFISALRAAESEGRITHLPYDASLVVNTYWDVGVIDYTVIWFVQEKADYINIIDCVIERGKDFQYLLNLLKSKSYKYGKNVLPHDMGRRQLPTLDTRLSCANSIAAKLGFSAFKLGRRYMREEMVAKAREIIARCRFDQSKCSSGLNALREFDANKRGVHSNSNMITDVADAFCYLAMDAKTTKEQDSLMQVLDKRRARVLDDYNPFEHQIR